MAGHTHDHGDHSHSHDHDHSHDGDTYFIDQLCMVGLSGAFGVICLCLWLWQTQMLTLMLGPQFHLYVLLSGIALTILAIARAVILWQQSRDPKFVAAHDHHHHDHAHDHDQQHAHAIKESAPTAVQSLPMTTAVSTCGHEHAPGETCGHGHEHHHHEHAPGEVCDHEHAPGEKCDHHHHAHEHNIGHAHAGPDHDEADHDHGWAPWRYVVVLLPIILFLLGVPNKPPALSASSSKGMLSPEVETYLHVLNNADTLGQLVYVGTVYNLPDDVADAKSVDFKMLELMASDAYRAQWNKKVVEVRGQYSPIPGSSQLFMLVRLKISCCANDAVQLDVPMVSREPITGIAKDEWVKVKGRVEFRQRGNSYMTVLLISKADNVEKCPPDPNPYIQ